MTKLYYRTLFLIVRKIVEIENYIKDIPNSKNPDNEEIIAKAESDIREKYKELLETVKEILYIESPLNLDDWPIESAKKENEVLPF